MSILFTREPKNMLDPNSWGILEKAQNRRILGSLTSFLYTSGSTLIAAKGTIGIDTNVIAGTIFPVLGLVACAPFTFLGRMLLKKDCNPVCVLAATMLVGFSISYAITTSVVGPIFLASKKANAIYLGVTFFVTAFLDIKLRSYFLPNRFSRPSN